MARSKNLNHFQTERNILYDMLERCKGGTAKLVLDSSRDATTLVHKLHHTRRLLTDTRLAALTIRHNATIIEFSLQQSDFRVINPDGETEQVCYADDHSDLEKELFGES